MINSIQLQNFGPIRNLDWNALGKINLIIGGNSQGKTFILKSIYSALRTLEDYKRGNDPRSASDILADKLYWTYQVDKIGDIVTKGADGPLSFKMTIDNDDMSYKFGKDTVKNILSFESHTKKRESNSVFLPAKEVLSIHHIILKSREIDQLFGFDDTYFDLAKALRLAPTPGRPFTEGAGSRRSLEDILQGKVEYDEKAGIWSFRKGNQKFPIGVTAEGVKKIAILDTLLANRHLVPDSGAVVFLDEPESALHPKAIGKLLDIVAALSERRIQFFLASHSYFVIKKLFIIAQTKGISIPVLSMSEDTWTKSDLLDGMPDNPIVDEAIALYEEEVELALS